MRADRGAGTVFAAFALLALLLLAAAGIEMGGAVVARHRAQSAADLAALAAAAQLVEGGEACAAAGRLAEGNRARLAECSIEGIDVVVRVSVALPLGVLGPAVAVARAGPVE